MNKPLHTSQPSTFQLLSPKTLYKYYQQQASRTVSQQAEWQGRQHNDQRQVQTLPRTEQQVVNHLRKGRKETRYFDKSLELIHSYVIVGS
jgi:hypothetical protein